MTVVTSARGVQRSAGEENQDSAAQTRKAPTSADTAFTRYSPSGFTEHLHGDTVRLCYIFFLSSAGN